MWTYLISKIYNSLKRTDLILLQTKEKLILLFFQFVYVGITVYIMNSRWYDPLNLFFPYLNSICFSLSHNKSTTKQTWPPHPRLNFIIILLSGAVISRSKRLCFLEQRVSQRKSLSGATLNPLFLLFFSSLISSSSFFIPHWLLITFSVRCRPFWHRLTGQHIDFTVTNQRWLMRRECMSDRRHSLVSLYPQMSTLRRLLTDKSGGQGGPWCFQGRYPTGSNFNFDTLACFIASKTASYPSDKVS